MTCWHCNGLPCACIFCGKETLAGFVAGPCGACKGRKEMAAFYRDCPDATPKGRQNWKRVGNPRDQQPAKAVFIPFDNWKKSQKEK